MAELKGKIKQIGETKNVSDTFQVKEVVVTVPNGNYPQDIPVEFVKDKISMTNGFRVGQDVTIQYDLRGREYNGRYFVSVSAHKVA